MAMSIRPLPEFASDPSGASGGGGAPAENAGNPAPQEAADPCPTAYRRTRILHHRRLKRQLRVASERWRHECLRLFWCFYGLYQTVRAVVHITLGLRPGVFLLGGLTPSTSCLGGCFSFGGIGGAGSDLAILAITSGARISRLI